MKRLLIASLRICSWSDMSGMGRMHQVFPLACWTMGESGVGSKGLSTGNHGELLRCVKSIGIPGISCSFQQRILTRGQHQGGMML